MEAFKSGKLKPAHVYITAKLWCTYHSRVEENLGMSLKSLGLEYVDLYLMHWTVPMNPKVSIHDRIYGERKGELIQSTRICNDPMYPTLPNGSRDLDTTWPHVQT